MVLALVLGLLLNADSLYVKAHAQDAGWQRRLAVAVMGPVRTIARTTRLDRPRMVFERTVRHIPDRTAPRGATSATTSTTIAPPVVRLRVPTPAEPLRLWVGGDSMAQVFGQSVVAKAVARRDIAATLDYRISTGLTRPDFFDWPSHLQDRVLPTKPEVIVIMFGANDAQSMDVDGKAEPVRSPVWQGEYRRRVAAVMDQLGGDGRLVVWVGQPIMRDSGFSEREKILDAIFADEAGRRPWIRFVDTRPVLSSDGTSYNAYLSGGDGAPVLMRQGDGIHLTRAGGDRVANAVLDVVTAEIAKAAGPGGLPPAAVPGQPPSGGPVTPAPAAPAPTAPAPSTTPPPSSPPAGPATTKATKPAKPWFAVGAPMVTPSA
jgi:hypothetical protein